jgi:hypothetical protein
MKKLPDNEAVLFGLERTSYIYTNIYNQCSIRNYIDIKRESD